MLIKYGCELSFIVDCPTPTFCMVDIHPDRRADVISETSFSVGPATAASDEKDAFGNRLRRFVAPAGETTVRHSGVIRDSGLPDGRDPGSRILSPTAIPPDVAV